MTKLNDLMNLGDLEVELQDGYVRERQHPHDDTLTILNYTEKAQYEKHWTDVTRQCRGLIVNNVTDEVLARPFDKFFNVGETEQAAQIDPTAEVEVTDKMDGSLGILYSGPDGWAIATRGSFESEQAIHATTLLREKYPDFQPYPGWTYLFEIVYPENRIVLDYHGADDLFLLGARSVELGDLVGPGTWDLRWSGPRTKTMPNVTSLSDALNMANRSNAEGVVIRDMNTSALVKVKQEDYVRLHKLVTGLNERAVWEHLAAHNGTYGELLAAVPDEFHEWVTVTADGFLDAFDDLQGWATWKYRDILNYLEVMFGAEGWERKDFALCAVAADHPALMFQMLDGRDISPAIWKTLRPKGETNSLLNRNEDNS